MTCLAGFLGTASVPNIEILNANESTKVHLDEIITKRASQRFRPITTRDVSVSEDNIVPHSPLPYLSPSPRAPQLPSSRPATICSTPDNSANPLAADFSPRAQLRARSDINYLRVLNIILTLICRPISHLALHRPRLVKMRATAGRVAVTIGEVEIGTFKLRESSRKNSISIHPCVLYLVFWRSVKILPWLF